IAYELSKKKFKKTVILEKGTVSSGSTGRCGGGIRAQWSTPENVRLAMASVKRFRELEEELGEQTEYEEGGYLILAHSDAEIEQFRKNVQMQKAHGLEVEILTPEETRKIVPLLNTEKVAGATWCPTDGSINPFLINFAYVKKALENGVSLQTRTEVLGIKSSDSKIQGVETSRGFIQTPIVVNAAGGYAADVGKMAGLDLPLAPHRHEILATEQINRFFRNMIMSFEYNVYFRQVRDGGIVGGQTNPGEKPGKSLKSGIAFLKEMSVKLNHFIPALGDVKILRQWAGLYCMSPDAQPILGKVSGIDGYFQACGFSGHGLMLAPRTAQIMANTITDEAYSDSDLERLSLERFIKGSFTMEKSVV
ncbi:FAD-binding oxidoreductase, partial [candidate division WOR-3 bacterium]|nr:FAD-binding oxidoreductase [candidate division WOR-3 bacterium]